MFFLSSVLSLSGLSCVLHATAFSDYLLPIPPQSVSALHAPPPLSLPLALPNPLALPTTLSLSRSISLPLSLPLSNPLALHNPLALPNPLSLSLSLYLALLSLLSRSPMGSQIRLAPGKALALYKVGITVTRHSWTETGWVGVTHLATSQDMLTILCSL